MPSTSRTRPARAPARARAAARAGKVESFAVVRTRRRPSRPRSPSLPGAILRSQGMTGLMNRFNLPDLGIGVGLRTVHFGHILGKQPDGRLVRGPLRELHGHGRPAALGPRPGRRALPGRAARRVAVDRQHRSRSTATTSASSRRWRKRVQRALDLRPPLLDGRRPGATCTTSCRCRTTRSRCATPRRACAQVSEILERPLVLENPSSYVEFTDSTMTEWEFLAPAGRRGGLRPAARRQQRLRQLVQPWLRSEGILDAIPADRVVQFHLAGHTNKGTHIIDTHNDHAIQEVWDLYGRSCRRTGNVATLLRVGRGHPRVRGRARRSAEGGRVPRAGRARRGAVKAPRRWRLPPAHAALDAGGRGAPGRHRGGGGLAVRAQGPGPRRHRRRDPPLAHAGARGPRRHLPGHVPDADGGGAGVGLSRR